MASVASEEPVEGKSVDEVPNGQQLCPSGEALVEWRSSEQIENGTPSTSPPYWDSDSDDGGVLFFPFKLRGRGIRSLLLFLAFMFRIDLLSQSMTEFDA